MLAKLFSDVNLVYKQQPRKGNKRAGKKIATEIHLNGAKICEKKCWIFS